MAVAEAVWPLTITDKLLTRPPVRRKRKAEPISTYVPERLIFADNPELTEKEISATARRVQDAYRSTMQVRIEASCSRVRSRQEVVLIQPAAPVRRVSRTKSAQKIKPLLQEPDPLTAEIHQLIDYYQDRHKAVHGDSGDFTQTTNFANVLRQRYMAAF